MFTIHDTSRQGLSRRDFLQIGSLGLGGFSLSQMLAAQALGAEAKPLATGKSVIFLFLHGGPTQVETFDPKMSAPDGNRSVTGEIPTALPGVTFGSTFTKLAGMADKLAVVRSYQPGDANHDIKPILHKEHTLGANLGSVYARVAGMNHPVTGMPSNVALFPQAVDAATQPAQMGFGNFTSAGLVGSSYAPFAPGGTGPSSLQQNMKLKLSRDRLDDRRSLLAQLDEVKRHIDATGTMDSLDRFQGQAFDVILRGIADAFDLSKEPAKLVARYDTAGTVSQIDQKWNNRKNYADNVKTLGKLLLLARRLCEAGCGFVTVTTNFVWDMHADVNNAGVAEGMRYMGAPLDHAVSAFLDDVEARGLSEKILLVACGEIGRTPRVNKNGGRDHWGNLGPLVFAGGGLKMGQVIGQSTPNAGEPATNPIRIPNVVATIMHTLFDVGEVRIQRSIPSDVNRVITEPEPIYELVG